MEGLEEKITKGQRIVFRQGDLKVTKSYKIAVIPGDGTGPEVTVEAVKVLKAAADKFGFKVGLTEFDFGGERYKRTGETLPSSASKSSANSIQSC